eukprot:scaffold5014_cov387-Prasinococcus_capsulatus_cf.AAC.17
MGGRHPAPAPRPWPRPGAAACSGRQSAPPKRAACGGPSAAVGSDGHGEAPARAKVAPPRSKCRRQGWGELFRGRRSPGGAFGGDYGADRANPSDVSGEASFSPLDEMPTRWPPIGPSAQKSSLPRAGSARPGWEAAQGPIMPTWWPRSHGPGPCGHHSDTGEEKALARAPRRWRTAPLGTVRLPLHPSSSRRPVQLLEIEGLNSEDSHGFVRATYE